LLNDESISDLMNDLYFKWIIQVTWKKLIDNHRKYISDLYLNKVKLNKQESNLKKLRKMWIIERKILADKKAYKERILKVSKWKQSYYSKYINDKLKIEKQLQLKSFKEKIRFNTIKKDILKKYNCKFVDLSNEYTAEARALSKKCLNINKMIYSESQLEKSWKESVIHFIWPVEPTRWISAFFHDAWYKKDFWTVHDAIDIITPQWTPIRAPADWYVVHITPPNSEDYAYVAIKHANWYMTVYGHVSDVLVKEFDFVKKWEVFAQTWWEFWTLWAWFMTTWPHLHFEVFKDREYIDPLTVLDLSHIQFSRLPEKYEFKFYRDFKDRRWYEFQNKTKNSRVFKLEWNNEVERQKYLINNYATPAFKNWQMWVDESLDWNIDPSFVMCIWLAETTLWRNLASAYNVWNVWNNDRWDRKALQNARSWIYLIISTLDNKYFNRYSHVNEMSWAWRRITDLPSCKEKWIYCYATDTENWHRNVIKCMSHLKWTYVPDDYNFRLDK
jgi:murein DD-endopeptidase MepM/ murein hydrolase activator NlpD